MRTAGPKKQSRPCGERHRPIRIYNAPKTSTNRFTAQCRFVIKTELYRRNLQTEKMSYLATTMLHYSTASGRSLIVMAFLVFGIPYLGYRAIITIISEMKKKIERPYTLHVIAGRSRKHSALTNINTPPRGRARKRGVESLRSAPEGCPWFRATATEWVLLCVCRSAGPTARTSRREGKSSPR